MIMRLPSTLSRERRLCDGRQDLDGGRRWNLFESRKRQANPLARKAARVVDTARGAEGFGHARGGLCGARALGRQGEGVVQRLPETRDSRERQEHGKGGRSLP